MREKYFTRGKNKKKKLLVLILTLIVVFSFSRRSFRARWKVLDYEELYEELQGATPCKKDDTKSINTYKIYKEYNKITGREAISFRFD